MASKIQAWALAGAYPFEEGRGTFSHKGPKGASLDGPWFTAADYRDIERRQANG